MVEPHPRYLRDISRWNKVYYPQVKVHGKWEVQYNVKCRTASEAIQKSMEIQRQIDDEAKAETARIKAELAAMEALNNVNGEQQ